MVIPIALVIILIIGMVISVGFRTDSIMKTQKKKETEFLLATVVDRLSDKTNFNDGIENAVDSAMYQEVIEDLSSNEEVMYENGNDLLNKIEVKNISEDEYKVIRHVIGTEFGFDNVFERDAWYKKPVKEYYKYLVYKKQKFLYELRNGKGQ